MHPLKVMGKAMGAAALCWMISGCVPLLVGAGTETAVVIAQERSPGHAIDDASILLKIKAKFLQQADKDMFKHVEVKVVEGSVLLTGNVEKPESQVEAVRLTWQVDGVKEVINEITVNDKAGFMNYARDVLISNQIRLRLIAAKDVHSINYSVLTVNQVVYLMGIAQDQAELDIVANIASTTNYVQKVVSYVRLKDDPRRVADGQ